jgi:hypothetical protein
MIDRFRFHLAVRGKQEEDPKNSAVQAERKKKCQASRGDHCRFTAPVPLFLPAGERGAETAIIATIDAPCKLFSIKFDFHYLLRLILICTRNCVHAVSCARLRQERCPALPPKCFAFRRDIVSRSTNSR